MTDQATSKIAKYVIHGVRADGRTTWWARVPWGTFQPYRSWAEAADYLALRHNLTTDNRPYRRGGA